MADIHVVPIGDRREHTLSADCECNPTVEVHGSVLVVIHNAYDFREVMEWLEENDD